MRLWDRLKSAFASAIDTFRHTGPGYDFSRWFQPRNIFLNKSTNTLANNETIFAAVSKLSNSIASLPVKLYKDFTPVYSRTADIIMNSPNRNMTSFDFFRTMEVLRNTFGNAYALKMYDKRYQFESLHILDPTLVEPVVDANTKELWYEVRGDKGIYYIHNMDIIHFKHIHTTGYKGINPLDVLRNTVHFDREVRQFAVDQMDTSIKASFILKMASNLSAEKRKEILDNFREFYTENGGVIIQEMGMEVHPITRNFIDTKVFEVEKITRARVATVFNMPIHMLGDEGKGYSSMEQASLEYVQGTIVPIIRQYEQELNRKLLIQQERLKGLYFKFNVNALLRGDMRTRGEFYFKGIRSGWFEPNEVRAYEELPPKPGGDKLYMSKDLFPIDGKGGDTK